MSYEEFVYTDINNNRELACSSDNSIDIHHLLRVLVAGTLIEKDSSSEWANLAMNLANGSIFSLTFKSIYGGPKYFDLLKAFQKTKSLNEIEFDAALFHQPLQSILGSLHHKSELTCLSIKNYEEVNTGLLDGIAQVINKPSGLETLKLNNLDIKNNDYFKLVCEAIANSTTLKYLEISNLQLSDYNLTCLSHALSLNQSIERIACNDETDEQLFRLAHEAFKKPKIAIFDNNQASNNNTHSALRAHSFLSRSQLITTLDSPKDPPADYKKSSCCQLM